jgi:hypothetical protein
MVELEYPVISQLLKKTGLSSIQIINCKQRGRLEGSENCVQVQTQVLEMPGKALLYLLLGKLHRDPGDFEHIFS